MMIEKKLLVFAFVMAMFPTVMASVTLKIDSVVINENYTHEISNDTSYFYGTTGQNATIDVTISSPLSDTDANAIVGMYLINESGSILNPGNVFQNRTVLVPLNGDNTTGFIWNINATTTLPTGRYNITIFVEYPFNSTENRTIYHRSEYIKLVSLQMRGFWMVHEDNDTTAGDEVEFRQTVTNTGTNTASARFIVEVWWDNDANLVSPFTIYVISSGGNFPVEPGETITKSFKWDVTDEGCNYADLGEWWTQSEFYYGYSKVNGETPTPNGVQYVFITVEEIVEGSETKVHREEYAPGDIIESIYWAANGGETNATIHEAKAWIEDENGNVVLDMSTFNDPRTVPGNGKCPTTLNIWEYNFDGVLPLSLSASINYKLIMGIDHGVPRGDYIQTNIYPYSGFNEKFEGSFQLVDARVRNIYSVDEIAYGVNAKFDLEVENIGINKIDEAPTIDLRIFNESIGYLWNWTPLMNLNAGQKKNSTIYWTPKSGEVPLGSYNVTATYKFGAGGTSSKSKIIRVVALGIINVTSPVVAPYDTVNITSLVQNLGTTNATVSSIKTTIDTGSTSISVGEIKNKEVSNAYNRSFIFPYTFIPISGVVNGSYPIYTNLSYGGTSFSNTFSNITLLPVGIKTFTVPSLGVNTSSVPLSVTLTNIGNSNVSVSLNISSNISGNLNQTTVTAVSNSNTTVNFNVNITDLGTHNITITANYSGLPQPLVRSGTIQILSTAPDLSISPSGISPSPSSPTTGQNVSITVSVSNGGTQDANNVKVEFILDNNVSMANNSINVANSSSNNTVFYWTATLGTHNITIVVDPDNSIVGEIDETNNNATVSITVTAPQQPSGGGGGGGGGGGLTYDVPKCVESLGTADLSGKEIAELAHECGHSRAPSKYIISPSYAPLAGVFASQDEVALSPELSEQLFESHPSSKQGWIIKKEPTILGEDIYQAAADYVLETTLKANKIVIVRGDLEADSIAASTFANLIGAKILLVKPDEVPYPTLDVLNKYRPNTIFIIGGEDAVSPKVANTVGKYAHKIERISGDTRYETSLEIARRVIEMSDPSVIVVTDGKEPVTYAASLAVKLNSPLVYMDENSPEEVFKFIGENDFKVVVKLYNE